MQGVARQWEGGVVPPPGLAAAADGVVLVDRRGRVLVANAAMARALGEDARALVGRSVDDILATPGDGAVVPVVALALARGGWRGDLVRRGVGVEGGVWDVVLTPSTERPDAVLGVFRDVATRHHAEQVRADFLSMVVHDIKGPLTVILGYAELMGESGAYPPEALADTLARIRESGEQIQALVGNFLELSRIEAGRLVLDRQSADLADIAERVVAQHQARARRKRQTLAWTRRSLPALSLDTSLMARVVGNLVGNAIKYTPVGGTIDVRVDHDGREAVLVVRDDGPGIAPEDLPHVFQKYRRARSTLRVEGTGLGLFITKTIVNAHGGDVAVETAPGTGSTFRVALPL